MRLMPNSSQKLPRSGTSNQKTITTSTISTSISPMMPYGSSLPMISSSRPSGVTFSCSSVPISRSRTMAIDDRFDVTTSSSSAKIPGSMK